jgi:histidinol-phosphate phosphatase family protein
MKFYVGLGEGRDLTSMALAVLFDRDGTLIVDVPLNNDPNLVVAMPGAREAVRRLRDTGIRTAVVSNQPGIASGRSTADDVAAINARAEALIGPLGPAFICPHAPADACACRKPAAGLLAAAARALHVRPEDCVMIGDIGTDMEAARSAGMRAILVPTEITKQEEIDAAPFAAANISDAIDAVLGCLV